MRDADTAAVGIAEAISHRIMETIGLQSPPCHAVVIDEDFAKALSQQYSFDPAVIPGRHWGTTFIGDTAQEIEFVAKNVSLLERPSDMFRLFLADIVLANPDRNTHGNLLLGLPSRARKSALIPIDHSDCFNHPSCLRNEECLTRHRGKPIAGWLPGTELVLLGEPQGYARDEMYRVSGLEATICDAVNAPPEEWYERAGVDPATLREFLEARVRNIQTLGNLQYWEGLSGAIGGGQILAI